MRLTFAYRSSAIPNEFSTKSIYMLYKIIIHRCAQYIIAFILPTRGITICLIEIRRLIRESHYMYTHKRCTLMSITILYYSQSGIDFFPRFWLSACNEFFSDYTVFTRRFIFLIESRFPYTSFHQHARLCTPSPSLSGGPPLTAPYTRARGRGSGNNSGF